MEAQSPNHETARKFPPIAILAHSVPLLSNKNYWNIHSYNSSLLSDSFHPEQTLLSLNLPQITQHSPKSCNI